MTSITIPYAVANGFDQDMEWNEKLSGGDEWVYELGKFGDGHLYIVVTDVYDYGDRYAYTVEYSTNDDLFILIEQDIMFATLNDAYDYAIHDFNTKIGYIEKRVREINKFYKE